MNPVEFSSSTCGPAIAVKWNLYGKLIPPGREPIKCLSLYKFTA